MHKIIHGLVDIKFDDFFFSAVRLDRTWSSHTFKLLEPYCKKNVFKFSFFPRTARDSGISSSLICLLFRPLKNFRTSLVNFLNK